MKQRLFFLCCVVLFFYACKNTNHKNKASFKTDNHITQKDSITLKNQYGTFTYEKEKYDKIAEKYHSQEDSIPIKDGDGFVMLDKEKFNEIVDSYPEFFQEEVLSPIETSKKANPSLSEAGLNWYFILYAHFLRQRYDAEKYKKEKERIVEIYLNSVALHGLGPNGRGTWHSHEQSRADAKAEYETYKLSIKGLQLKSVSDFQKDKQKYIKSLWENLDKGKEKGFGVGDLIEAGDIDGRNYYRRGEKTIYSVDSLITNSFYLEAVQNM